MSARKFRAAMAELCRMHGREPDWERISLYQEKLSERGYDLLDAARAVDRIMCESPFFPKLGDIGSMIKEMREAEASAAWDRLMIALGKGDSRGLDDATLRAVKDLGGFARLGYMDYWRLSHMRQLFIELHRSYSPQEPPTSAQGRSSGKTYTRARAAP